MPLDATPVRNELLRYLPETWTAVFDRDVDGAESSRWPSTATSPRWAATRPRRRVARTIFIGSAPSVAGQRVRGLEEIRVRLGCAQPGEPTAIFGDALRRMGSLLTYLYTDGSRYWYDTRPTVNRLAQDRAQGFPAEEVSRELVQRLNKVGKTRDFAGFHVALPAPATWSTSRPPEWWCSTRRPRSSVAMGIQSRCKPLKMFLESRGNAQRLYKNMLVFIAPDQTGAEALQEAAREYLAWKTIQGEEEQLNLDAQQRRQVRDSLAKADETVDRA